MNILKKPVIPVALAVIALAVGIFVFRPSPGPPAKAVAATAKTDAPILAPDDHIHAQYAGSQSCQKCHAVAYEKWLNSNHGLAERDVKKEEDHKAFSPKQTLAHGKDTTEAFVDADGLAKFLTLGRDNQRQVFKPVRVIGNNPLRQFLIPAPGGRLQTLDVSLDPAKNEWFDVYGNDDERAPGDWGHWTGQGMNWNAMCAACHNTRLRKNYEPGTNSYHTSMAEMSVGCEACHGPMKAHVEWQEKPPLDKKTKDPTVHKFTRDQTMETCAACHSRRSELTGDLVPGESFYDHFSLTITDGTDIYHPDGQVRDEDYEFASFLSSRMHHAGVRCADCHDPHNAKRVSTGNQLCMNCHTGGRGDYPTAPVIDPTSHSHHGADSTGNQCVSCHMPVTTYMQRHPRHDHSFSIPDPKLTKELGVPNACNRCHTDKDADWAIASYKNFYGEKPDRPSRTRTLLVASARRGEPAARDGLIKLLASDEIPAWKATACRLLERWALDPAAIQALRGQLSHENPLVREAAVRALGITVRENNPAVGDALKPLLEDESRSVRIAAAWALVEQVDLTTRTGKELVHMLDINADQPTGRMQLAQFAMRRGDTPAAIRQMKKAIEWDPNSPPFHHDLAILLSTTGDPQAAVTSLKEAIRLDPGNAEYHYKLALALNETGSSAESTAELEKTVELDPSYARAWYNLGLARSGTNQPRAAIEALLKAEAADPSDPSIPYARATIHARLGQKNEALNATTRALQLRPDFQEAKQLLQMLAR
ncbi:tetratricopeptide repeat protein [Luteolibacter yonseiensis]|uniref:Tetratricopeptide repeat protein n=1 Tax=Luteolibacter yonseiensis TaxID=1144680 RepID=A0A934R2E8_9BACT|nr:tetratricopeptide repeat protein [Luteolibacter yonseiensis]MBK1815562.1 tetratricopeptide repeat protein [Luteolibacter yonseiensis]